MSDGATTSTEWRSTACILCSINCGVEVRTEARRIVRVRGDKSHPGSQGYTCEKALRLDHYQNARDRLTHPLRRRPDGTFEVIDWDTAIQEIAARLGAIRDTYGGERVLYYGGGGQGNHLCGVYASATRRALERHRAGLVEALGGAAPEALSPAFRELAWAVRRFAIPHAPLHELLGRGCVDERRCKRAGGNRYEQYADHGEPPVGEDASLATRRGAVTDRTARSAAGRGRGDMDEVLINTTTAGDQGQPSVCGLQGTQFVVVWEDRSDGTIKGQMLGPTGLKSSSEFRVNLPTPPGPRRQADRRHVRLGGLTDRTGRRVLAGGIPL